MNHDERREIEAFFDECARRGDMADFSPEEGAQVEALIERWGIGPGLKVLEVGCGSGRLTRRLAGRVGPEGEILAMDVSGEMIRAAQHHAPGRPVEFLQGDVSRVPRPDALFDAALLFCVFPHLRPPQPALAELARVVRPGGRLWVCHLLSSAAINDFHRGVGTAVAHHHLPDADTMRALLDDAGFEVLSIRDDDSGYTLEAVREG